MLLTNKAFEKHVNKIVNAYTETTSSKYYKTLALEHGNIVPYNNAYEANNGTDILNASICSTSILGKSDNINLHIPCKLLKSNYSVYTPLELSNIIFFGAYEDSKHTYKVLLRIFFNNNKSVRNKVLTIKHLTIERILHIIEFLNIASNRIDIDLLNYKKIEESQLFYINEEDLVYLLIEKMKYKVYEEWVNRPGREDYFFTLKEVNSIPKSKYFKKLVQESVTDRNSPESLSHRLLKSVFPWAGIAVDPNTKFNLVLNKDNSRTTFPKPNENISEGSLRVDRYLVEIIRRFSKNDYLLEDIILDITDIDNKWNTDNIKRIGLLMGDIMGEEIEGISSEWMFDNELTAVMSDFSERYDLYGYVFKLKNILTRNANFDIKFFLNTGKLVTSAQFFEIHFTPNSIFIPLGFEKNIEDFFKLNENTKRMYNLLKSKDLLY